MKVLHIISSLGGGGRERRMVQLCIGLRDSGLEQFIVTMSENIQYAEVYESGAQIKIINGNDRRQYIRDLDRIIAEIKPDIVHSWVETKINLIFLPLLKLKYGFKLIMGFVADGNPIKRFSTVGLCMDFSRIFTDAIVSNSKAGLKAKHLDCSKANVIYNGFDFTRFDNCSDPMSVRKEVYGSGDFLSVLMGARISPAKDYGTLLEVASIAKQRGLKTRFYCAGGGEQLDYYKNLARQRALDNVYFLGLRRDMEDLIQACDVAILLTNNKVHAEGVSNFIMESMAASKVVIATDGGGTPEIIENGVNGFIVRPGDASTIVNLLESLSNDAMCRNSLGTSAKKCICDRFMLDHMCLKYLELYKNLLCVSSNS